MWRQVAMKSNVENVRHRPPLQPITMRASSSPAATTLTKSTIGIDSTRQQQQQQQQRRQRDNSDHDNHDDTDRPTEIRLTVWASFA